jgi:hypothetical protein
MSEPMDVDSETHRGVKRKADDFSEVTAPRRIQVGLVSTPPTGILY